MSVLWADKLLQSPVLSPVIAWWQLIIIHDGISKCHKKLALSQHRPQIPSNDINVTIDVFSTMSTKLLMAYPASQMTGPIPWKQPINQVWRNYVHYPNTQISNYESLKVNLWIWYNQSNIDHQSKINTHKTLQSLLAWLVQATLNLHRNNYSCIYYYWLDLFELDWKGHVVTDGSHFEY